MDSNVILPKEVRFWCLAIPLILSIVCSLFVLYYFIFDRTQRHALNNHVFAVIVATGFIYEITIFPWMLYQYRLNDIWIRSRAFCAIWSFLDYGLYIIQTMYFAWATIERHILIFHDHWMRRKRWRFFLHYLPLIVIFVYCMIVYSITYYFPPCENLFFDSDSVCTWPCLWLIQPFTLYELFVNELFPVLVIIIFSLLLFVRVIWMKCRVHQGRQWRKHFKMAIQLFTIISVYLVLTLPSTINLILYWLDIRSELIQLIYIYFSYITYFPTIINPFICLFSSNELRARFFDLFRCRFRPARAVGTVTVELKLKTLPPVS